MRLQVRLMLVFGFASGLPLALTSGTLQAWLTLEGADVRLIGLFTLTGLPYALKFLWAPLLDRYAPPWLDRRRGWIFLTQVGLAFGLAGMAGLSPANTPWLVGALAMLVALLSASQDVVSDAYRTDVLAAAERGSGAGLFVGGYRVAMQVSGALALVLAERIGWPLTYLGMAALMLCGAGFTVIAPSTPRGIGAPRTLADAYLEPLREFASRRNVLLLLALIVLYKIGDAFAGSLATTFFLRGPGFAPTDVGLANIGGFVATLGGLVIGGWLMTRWGLYRSLLWFGVLQAVSNLVFIALALAGDNLAMLWATVIVEHLSGGMGTAAFVALLMALCDHRFTAAQYALLSAFSSFGRVFVGPAAGWLVYALDWVVFFAVSTAIAVPGILLLMRLRAPLAALDADNGAERDAEVG